MHKPSAWFMAVAYIFSITKDNCKGHSHGAQILWEAREKRAGAAKHCRSRRGKMLRVHSLGNGLPFSIARRILSRAIYSFYNYSFPGCSPLGICAARKWGEEQISHTFPGDQHSHLLPPAELQLPGQNTKKASLD